MIMLLAALWLWDSCDSSIVAFRVEMVRRYQIGIEAGRDQDGNPTAMPIYMPWQPVLIQKSMDQMALVPCEPLAGEVCVTIVTSIDEAGNLDEGVECS